MIRTARQPRAARCRPAFTLFELVVVLFVTAVISAIAVPRFGDAAARYRADAAARRLAADLELVRVRARTGGGARAVGFDVAAGSYQVLDTTDPDRPLASYVVDLTRDPYRAALVSVDLGGAAQLTYDAYGLPDRSAVVVVRSGPATRTVTVNVVTGKTRIE